MPETSAEPVVEHAPMGGVERSSAPRYRGTVGYLIGHFPQSSHTFFYREVCQLRRLGIDVVAISTRAPEGAEAAGGWRADAFAETVYLDREVRERWGRIVRTFCSKGLPKAILAALTSEGPPKYRAQSVAWLAHAAALVGIARDRGFSHVHVGFSENASQVALLASRLGGLRYSFTPGHYLFRSGPNQPAKWRNAAFASSISQFLVDEARGLIGDANMPPFIEIAPRGVDAEEFKRTSPYEPWDGVGRLRLFGASRLTGTKGHLDGMRCLATLRDRGIDVELRIAGDATDTRYVKCVLDLAEELGVRDRVELLGIIDPAEVRREHERAHVFLHLALEEGLGNAVLEAMAMGTPIVASGVGGILESVEADVQGILLPPGSPVEAADAVERVARDAALARRMSAAGRDRCVNHYYATRGAEVVASCLARIGAVTVDRGGSGDG